MYNTKMPGSIYFEDIFLEFFDQVHQRNLGIQYQDISPINSFYSKVVVGEQLTANQGSYLIKILEKYKKICQLSGFDYVEDLKNATWKIAFRVLDLTKKIYVEKNEKGKLEICCKFPYQLKNDFEKEIEESIISNNKTSSWDHEKKIRRLNLYDVNLISLYEFASKHGFEIDETFMVALADVEEIWLNEDSIRPLANVETSFVTLKNQIANADDYFSQNRAWTSRHEDMFLAKSMGFLYYGPTENLVEKIAASSSNTFWMKDNISFFNLYKTINGRVAVVLDRSSETIPWLKNFVHDAELNGIDRSEIKVCFRDNKDSDSGLNDWIKLAGVGGKVDTGKILIFEHKPAKWLFKDKIDVKFIVTNNLYPHTNQITKDWLDSHPCVIYLGNIKPSEQRGKKIVEL